MEIDVALGTIGRFDKFQMVIRSLNSQRNVGDLHLYILDGNGDSSVQDFLNSEKFLFGSVHVFKERDVLPEASWGLWPQMYNFLIKKGSSPLVTYWSDDVYPDEDCFLIGSRKFEDPKVGAVAFAWRDGIKRAYSIYNTEYHKQVMVNFGLFKRKILKKVNYIDEGYKFYNADQDLSLKVWYEGARVLKCVDCRVTHDPGCKSKNKYRGGKHHNHDQGRIARRWSKENVKDRKIKY